MTLLQKLGVHCGVELDVLRLDRGHNLAPGNKWFKLSLNLLEARRHEARTLVSFGGVWSNHIHALAAIAKAQGFASLAYVRGELADTAMLNDVRRWGMQLRFLNRSDYRRRADPAFHAQLLRDIDRPYLIPEGGANALGVAGCRAIVELFPEDREYDAIYTACGTGTTLAGLIAAYRGKAELVGIPVLKAESFMASDIRDALGGTVPEGDCWRLDHRFHGGGYAKVSAELGEFIREFEGRFDLPLDPVYTAKLFFAVWTMLARQEIPAGHRVLLIHSGGLQGRRGFAELFEA